MNPTSTAQAYPIARKDDVVDNYHGTRIKDPYRWLENPEGGDTREYVQAQQEFYEAFMRDTPREAYAARLRELADYAKWGVPVARGGKWFYLKNDGLSNQPTLYVQQGQHGEPKTLIDPNALSERGTVFLSGFWPSPDGSLLAYTTSEDGSDWQVIHTLVVETGEVFEEKIQWTKFTTVVWDKGSVGFYYNRLPQPGTVPPEDQHNFCQVFFHRVGTPQQDDVLIYEEPERKELSFWLKPSSDGNYLIFFVFHGSASTNRVYVKDIAGDGPVVKLLNDADARYVYVGNKDDEFFFHTDLGATNGRIVAINIDNPARERWRSVVTVGDDILAEAAMAADKIVVTLSRDVAHYLNVYDLNGALLHEVNLPGPGQVLEVQAKADDPDVLFGFETFLTPKSVYRLNVDSGKLESVFESRLNNFDADQYEVHQQVYASKDGTKVPMYLLHKKGLERNGDNPTLLYGYGGFNRALMPTMMTSRLLWIEQGGVVAIPSLRGGSEFGEDWHKTGMLEKKQNVFDDFIAAAEWLIDNNFTRTEKLAIGGRSNGGLLVGACMTQRPDLFGAVVCGVPVADMLRYHHFTVGRFWAPEYGNAETNAEHFKFLIKYSPLHTVKKGATYPPTLVFTAASDDRVVPAHALKFVATLQANDAGENPIILRYESHAGHGMGKPVSKLIEEQQDIHAFLVKVLHMS